MICPNCGKEITDTSKFCTYCGARQPVEITQVCVKCGLDTPEGATFCPYCGVDLRVPREICPPIPPTHVFAYAGFWLRFLAYLIDDLIISFLVTPLYFIIFLPLLATSLPVIEHYPYSSYDIPVIVISLILKLVAGIMLYCFLALVVTWLYYALTESSQMQATLGKMALGIVVTDLYGRRVSFGRASARFFGKILSDIYYIGYILAGFTEKKQALHDIIAGCLVIKRRREHGVPG